MDEKKLRTNPVKVIRAYCLDCCLASSYEVALCPAANCPLWPFRFGKNPYRAKREITEEQRQRGRESMARLQAARRGNA